MRKSEIVVTTPLKSIIYAYGTAKIDNPEIYRDAGFYNKQYIPAYVLEIGGAGSPYAMLLVRDGRVQNSHRDIGSRVPKDKIASALDALQYTVNDVRARGKVLETHSHWPLSPEQAVLRNEDLAALRQLPLGWNIMTVNVQFIRMLWAEYVVGYEQCKAELAAKKKAEEDQKTERGILHAQATIDLAKYGVTPPLFHYWNSGIELTYEDLNKVLNAKKGDR